MPFAERREQSSNDETFVFGERERETKCETNLFLRFDQRLFADGQNDVKQSVDMRPVDRI